jgi:hypothetical protein
MIMIVINGSIGNWVALGISLAALLHIAEPSVIVDFIAQALTTDTDNAAAETESLHFDPGRRLSWYAK